MCLLVATATPQVIEEETAPGFVDQAVINIASASEAVVEGAGTVLETTGGVLQQGITTLGPWIALAAVGYLLIVAPPRFRSNPSRSREPYGPPFKSVRKELRKYGIAILKVEGEYRVNFRGGKEATAYYTNDLRDAYDTGIAMAVRALH
jgi:hypothetical protein